MATLVLSAAGATMGSALGGSMLGLSTAVLGRTLGATAGRLIDQQILGSGSAAVETGKIERFRLTGASEGSSVGRLWGRNRISGQVIWASRFKETVGSSAVGGKGTVSSSSQTKEYSYSVSLAIALCEGPIARIGRIWADGNEIEPGLLNARVYSGTDIQLADPLIEAIEGTGMAPSYRGIAYVVIEDLDLGLFGNRVPQFSFEVVRLAQSAEDDLAQTVQAVSLIPGTGEYALATTPVHIDYGFGQARSANVNSPSGRSDIETSLDELRGVLPRVRSVSLVVSWFSGDLRVAYARLEPKVEQKDFDGSPVPWRVAGLSREEAAEVPRVNGEVIYGGTPTDASVIEAIKELRRGGQEAVFYPFILMDQLEGNTLLDPYSGEIGQAHLPWRGRITLSFAPSHPASPDGRTEVDAEVEAFFGTAEPGDFELEGDTVRYTGSDGWSYRRFILHYAHLCAAAGGVAGFCIGSELRGVTTIRGEGGQFPAVAALAKLAADVRSILGPDCKIGYAADWSEYFGYQPPEAPSDIRFHLDSLWADPNVDFIGIDNYMPLSDWRDGETHADAAWGAIYDLDYLRANIEGGEGYNWFYPAEVDRVSQNRVPITDGAHQEPWLWRYKDIGNWWKNPHHDRIGGVRQDLATDWVPESKPIWFTEVGCPAVDKGSNAPNLFVDPKSSETAVPPFSTGTRDDLIQRQYLRAVLTYWDDPVRNPVSAHYGGPMIDLTRAHVWAWDARPFPQFPNNRSLWSDAPNYRLGHWLNGRASAQALDAVVADICVGTGVGDLDVGKLYGLVRGYTLLSDDGGRAALQPLLLAYGVEAAERDGKLVFFNRQLSAALDVNTEELAWTDDLVGQVEYSRSPDAETAGCVRLTFIEADGAYETRSAEAALPDPQNRSVMSSEMPVVLTVAEGQAVVERWLAETRVGRDRAKLVLPPSTLALGAGDILRLPGGDYRIDRVDHSDVRTVEAVRIERNVFIPPDTPEEEVGQAGFVVPLPVCPVFLDLPLLTGEEMPCAPYVAVAADPWPGSVAVFSAVDDAGYTLDTLIERPSVTGVTESLLLPSVPSRWDRGPALRVKLSHGALASTGKLELFAGSNTAAIGDFEKGEWEVFQFAGAELVAPMTYELRMRLRGQSGTEHFAGREHPAGSCFVLLDAAPIQISLPVAARGLERHYRIGPSIRGYEDSTYRHFIRAFEGVALRPYAPCHVRAERDVSGDLYVTWIRRTRIDGDNWASVEVPVGEAREFYLLRVIDQDGTVLRTASSEVACWNYGAAEQVADGVAASPFAIEVAQLSDQFGPGPYLRIEIND